MSIDCCQRFDCGHPESRHDETGFCLATACGCRAFQEHLDPLADSVADECPTCGAWMLNPALHANWHQNIDHRLRAISEKAGRYVHPPTYATFVEPTETPARVMIQVAPYPEVLERLVDNCKYRPGWTVALVDRDRGQGSKGLTLIITTLGYNSYHPEDGETYRVQHYMPVPPAAFDERSWRRWLFEQFLLVERHEACEFFQLNGDRPYAPHHGPGNDPYIVFDHGSDLDVRTSFRGEVKP